MAKAKVRISEPNLDKNDYFSIARFADILQNYASIWGVRLLARSPDIKPVESYGKYIEINFFYRSSTSSDQEGVVSSIFGYKSSVPLRCHKPPVMFGSYNPWTGLNYLYDFNGYLVASINGNSINIEFDFLRNSWDGHEDVLNLILFWCLARIRSAKPTGDVRAHSALAGKIREDFAKKEIAGFADFADFQKRLMEKSVENYLRSLEGLAAQMKTTREKWVQTLREILELEEYIARITETVASQDFAQDFDQLLRLNGVAKIEVCENRLIVHTRRLCQYFGPSLDKLVPHDIGVWQISISPESRSQAGIIFTRVSRGAYQPAYLPQDNRTSVVCFGSSEEVGRNAAISEQMVDYNIPVLLGFIFSFLRGQSATPTGQITAVPAEELALEPAGYGSVEEYEDAKSAYVDLVIRVKSGSIRSEAEARLERCRDEAESLRQKFIDERIAKSGKENFIQFLSRRLLSLENISRDSYRDLWRYPVLGVEVKKDDLRIWIYHREKFPYPGLLCISANSILPRLVWPFEFQGRDRYHSILYPADFLQRLVEGIASGKVTDVVDGVLGFVTREPPAPVSPPASAEGDM